MNQPARRILQALLLLSRWLLAPFYFMLIIGLAILLYQCGHHIYAILSHLGTATENEVTVDLLKMVDLTLLASLIVIVIVSGYENFITPFQRDASASWPVWMSQIDFSGLKLKLLASIAAIAAIQLLEVFMDLPNVKDRDILWYVVVMLTFALAGLIMAVTDYITDHSNGHSKS